MEQENRFDQERYLIELRKRDSLELIRKQAEIQALKMRIVELNNQSIPRNSFDEMLAEMKVIGPFTREVRYSQTFISDLDTIDTVTIFSVRGFFTDSLAVISEKRLRNWLAFNFLIAPCLQSN